MTVPPSSAPPSRDFVPPLRVLRARKRMLDTVRRYFDGAGLLEVETPIAVPSPGLEPHLSAFETSARAPGSPEERLYLHTSPEYAMKRLLGRGIGSIYQVARVFRNGERSRTHAPEFTMLEWYRTPGTLEDLIDDVEHLVARVAEAVGGPWRPRHFVRTTVSEAFRSVGLPDPLRLSTVDALQRGLSVPPVEGDDWGDVFFRAFFDRVEPNLSADTVTTLTGYPACMAALARIDPTDPTRALRFEVFAGRLELGNAFDELTDSAEQRARFMQDQKTRRTLGRPVYPIDEGLLSDLGRIDRAAGIALGLDRLLMVCLGASSIQDVIAFSPRNPRDR